MSSIRHRRLAGVFLVSGAVAIGCSSSSNGTTATNSSTVNHESSRGSGGGSSESSSGTASEGHNTSNGSASSSGSLGLNVASQFGVLGGDQSSSSCTGSTDGGTGTCTTTNAGQSLIVALTNRGSLSCATIDMLTHTKTSFANLEALALEIANGAGDLTPGTYNVLTQGSTATSGSGATFSTTSATCVDQAQLEATAGTVTVSAITSTMATGTYDLTFGTSGSLSGSFNVSICTLPDAGQNQNPDAAIDCVQ